MDSPSAVSGLINSSDCRERVMADDFGSTENRPLPNLSPITEDQRADWQWETDGGNLWIRYRSNGEV
jgi:hypothetical protein